MRRPWMLPLVPLYAVGAAVRWAGVSGRKLAWPVVSVGNLSMGGTGKTPFTVALARLLTSQGIHVDVLSRGYGRQESAALRVEPAGSAEKYGDEPLLIANEADVPVYVATGRWKAGKLAEREWAQQSETRGVHLLDDGFQHRQLARDVDIVLVNSEDLKDCLLPAGNLREGLGALNRASVLAVPYGDNAAVEILEKRGLGPQRGQVIWRFWREMAAPVIPETLAAMPVVAFCGIARPEQFFTGLEQKGMRLAARRIFSDHHIYTRQDVAQLQRLVASSGAGALVTTDKDLYRMGDLAASLDGTHPFFAAGLRVELDNEAGAAAWLKSRLGY